MATVLIAAASHVPALAQVEPPSTTTTSSSSSTSTTTSTSTPEAETTTTSSVAPDPGEPAPAADPASVEPDSAEESPDQGPPPASVSEGVVADFLDSMVRTPANSTRELLAALQPLRDIGFSAEEVAYRGMGRFPIAGEAFFRDDFGEFRAGPPVHPHQGTDIWAAFDVPVRSPADGVVRFEDAGLGGKAAYVTEADGTFYYLAHLSGFASDLANGDLVRVGDIIGYNGDSGNAVGGPPHVHFEIHPWGGAAVNPKPFLDKWLLDALAAVPALLKPYLPGGGGSRPLTALSLARHFDGGLLTGPDRAEDGVTDAESAAAQELAGALVTPLTPVVMRNEASPFG